MGSPRVGSLEGIPLSGPMPLSPSGGPLMESLCVFHLRGTLLGSA
jgi:hypothetical protein